jgi:hypothetical protein
MTILLALLAAQDVVLDDLYQFKPGTSWTYKRIENTAERKIEAKVVESADGRVKLAWNEVNIDATPYKKSVVTWFVKDGVLRVEARGADDEGAFELPILKAGVKKDDRWTSPEGESTYLGTSEIKVAAGAYKGAHHVRLKLGEGAHIDMHLAPKVGLVKLEVTSGEGPNSFELTGFTEAK